jgi:hypothetical protein
MDVSLSVRFTATERRERGAARRVPIDSDLWSERSTIHARHFASPRSAGTCLYRKLNSAIMVVKSTDDRL